MYRLWIAQWKENQLEHWIQRQHFQRILQALKYTKYRGHINYFMFIVP